MLSISDIIVSQKLYNGNEGSISLGGATIFLALFVQKLYMNEWMNEWMGKHIKSKELYSIVQKRHKTKPNQANGDYC